MVPLDPYTCIAAVDGDTRPQGYCLEGMVQVPPTLVVFSAEIPPAGALGGTFVLGLLLTLSSLSITAMIIGRVRRLIEQS